MPQPRILKKTSFDCRGASGKHQMQKQGETGRGNIRYDCRFCDMTLFDPNT